jgi:hypothetical protein
VQWVKILGHKSAVTHVPSGIPQGGHLSPLLFAVFINVIKQVVPNCDFLIFADDLKLFRKISSIHDCLALQNDLNNIVNWLISIGLHFNIEKCKSMTFSRSHSIIKYSYQISGSSLVSVNTNKDLGIILTPTLNFNPHIESICCKALKVLGFIKRISVKFKLAAPLKTIYCSFVRSILEYSSVLWDPHTASSSFEIERVQRCFLSFAAYVLKIEHPQHDYSNVLNYLSLSSLADRRVAANLNFLSKLVDGSIDSPNLLSQVNFRVPPRSLRFHAPFVVPVHDTNYGRNHPIHRMMRLANENPSIFNF